MLGQLRRKWTNIDLTMDTCLVFAGVGVHAYNTDNISTEQARDIE